MSEGSSVPQKFLDYGPDERLFEQAVNAAKFGSFVSLTWGMMDVLPDVGKKPGIKLAGRLVSYAYAPIAISFLGVGLTSAIYKLRGKENWRSKTTPYWLGFTAAGATWGTYSTGSSLKGFGRGLFIGAFVMVIKAFREHGIIGYTNPLYLRTETTQGGNADWGNDLSFTDRAQDPGRWPVGHSSP